MYLIFLIRVNCGAALNHSQKQARNPSTVEVLPSSLSGQHGLFGQFDAHNPDGVGRTPGCSFAMLGIWIFFECFAELDGVLSVARCVIVHHQCHTCTCIRCAHWFSSDSLSLQHILSERSKIHTNTLLNR